MLPALKRKISARKKKKKKESVWRDSRTFSCLLVASVLLLLLALLGHAEASGTELVHAFGDGTGNYEGKDVIQHSIDQGFLISGTWLLKTDSAGVEQWASTPSGGCIIEHSIDQGFAIFTLSSTQFMLLVKMNSVGVVQWAKIYGSSTNEFADSVIEHSLDTGFVLAGSKSYIGAGHYEMKLVKTNSVGVHFGQSLMEQTCLTLQEM
jgi:hypothetical protein